MSDEKNSVLPDGFDVVITGGDCELRFLLRQRRNKAKTRINAPTIPPTIPPAMSAVFVDEPLGFGGEPGDDDEVGSVFVVDGVILC